MSPPAAPDALAALYRREAPALYRLALAITASPEAAEDVVQAAFVRALERRERLDPERVGGYLCRIARNLAHDHLRRRGAAERAQQGLLLLAPRADAPAGDGPDAEALSRALFALPVEQREVVLLRVVEGLPFQEVAARCEAPLGTVHSRYRYAVERLRALLGRSL